MTSPKLVDWYVENKTFDNFKGNKRDEILDSSSKEFFNMMKNDDKLRNRDKLKYSDFKPLIQDRIENDANVWFDEKLQRRIDDSILSKQKEFAKRPSSYNSEAEVEQDIQKTEEFIKTESINLKKELENLEFDFEDADNFGDLERIRSRANALPDSPEKRQLIDDIVSDERGLRELESIEENKTKWRDIIRYDKGTPEEIDEATENLRELNSKSLGQVRGLKSKDIERSAMGRFFRNE